MQVVNVYETGGPEQLRVEEGEPPQPADGQVLLRVHAASVNPIDWKYRRGVMPKELPAVLGSDVSGTVLESRSDAFAPGDEVFGFAAGGAYAEQTTAPAQLLARKPAGVSHEQAAAVPVAGLTAWQALFERGGLGDGQSALIVGAAGGVGHFAVQFARHRGVRAVGVASARNRDFVLDLGASEFVDYASEDPGAPRELDLVFDAVGADSEALLGALKPGGRLITIAGAPPEQAARERGLHAELLVMQPSAEQLATVAELIASGEVQVEIAATFPLSRVAEAHELSEGAHARGKIVLVPDAQG